MSSTLLSIIPAGVVVLWVAGKLFRRWAVSYFTITFDLPSLGTPRKHGQKFDQTAIICGGRFAPWSGFSTRTCIDAIILVVSLVSSLPVFVPITTLESSP
jgi:hypothetical protein